MKRRSRRNCQSFSITLPDGQVVHGHGQFAGPITERDREAIAGVVAALKAVTRADRIDSVMLMKPDDGSAVTDADRTELDGVAETLRKFRRQDCT